MSLDEHQQSLVDEFTLVSGLNDDNGDNSVQEKIVQLLTIYDWDLNNAVMNYFDSGFESINQPTIPSHPSPPQSIPQYDSTHTGAERYEDSGFDLHHRHGSTGGGGVTNLQNQMFLDDFIPRLPKAPKISNYWSLELGIHTSLKEEKEKELKENDDKEYTESITSEAPKTRNPLNSIWIILLIIPKTLLQVILSVVRYIFRGFGHMSSSAKATNRFPNKFIYDNYEEDFNFLNSLKLDFHLSDKIETEKDESKQDDQDSSLLLKFNFFDQDFNTIHAQTQNNYEWLLVILINDQPESHQFIKSLIKSKSFSKLFDKSEGLYKDTNVYINNVDKSPEAFEVGHTYKVKKIPYIMLIGNITNNPSIMSSMSMVYKSNLSHQFLENDQLTNSTAKKILKNLSKLLDNFNAQLITKKIDKQEIELSRIIKEQQDDAYLKSLEQDNIKKVNKKILVDKEQELLNLAKLKESFFFKLIQTNWFENLNEDTLNGTIKVAIKLPNGKRIVEVISKSIRVIDLYMYVNSRLFINQLLNQRPDDFANEDEAITFINGQDLQDQEAVSHDDFFTKFPVEFELIQPFPKKIIKPSSQIINDVGELKAGGNLLVEYIETESDSEVESESDDNNDGKTEV